MNRFIACHDAPRAPRTARATSVALLALACAACCLTASACTFEESPGSRPADGRSTWGPAMPSDTDSDEVRVTEASVLAELRGTAYRATSRFAHLTAKAYPSTAAEDSLIESWVTRSGCDEYRVIVPDATGTRAVIPPGTVLVREVLNAEGKVTKITAMAKMSPGYNPAIGDYWFGVLSPSGVPLTGDGGVKQGKMTECYSCHLARDKDDFLFGVPASAQAAHP